MCGCRKGAKVAAFNCKNYSISDLNIWLLQYICVFNAGTYGSIGMSLSHVNGQIATLNTQIAVLTGNPNSNTYCSYVPLFLSDSTKMTSIGC